MKNFLAILFFLLSINTYANFPISWINPESQSDKGMIEKEEKDFETSFGLFTKNLDSSIQKVNSTELSKKNWYLQSIKAELGIENVGKFGLVGVKGETAVEFIWARTKKSLELLKKQQTAKSKKMVSESEKDLQNELQDDQLISDSILAASSDTEIDQIAEKYVDALYESKKITNRSNLKEELVNRFFQFKQIVSQLSEVSQAGPWWVYKYQMELFVEVSGKLSLGFSVGNGNRLRLEWYRYEKVNNNGDKNNHSKFQSFLSNLSQDLDALSIDKFEPLGYSFDAFKVGIGVGAKGDLFFAKAKGSVLGALFFRRDGTWSPRPVKPSNQTFVYSLVTNNSTEGESILRSELRNGLSGASDMALKMLNAAEKGVFRNKNQEKMKHFELSAMEIEFELFGRGFFGPVTLEGIAVAEIFLIKK